MMRLALAFVAVLPLLSACESVDETAGAAQGPTVVVRMFSVSETGIGAAIGTVTLADAASGLTIQASLEGLPPGQRGFHVHEKGDCGPALRDGKPVAALAAGGHFDGTTTGRHEGPHGQGHRGDLPALLVGDDGKVDVTLTAPRLALSDIRGRSIMIHAGGDNYSDQPQPLGGGGARIACGVISPSAL